MRRILLRKVASQSPGHVASPIRWILRHQRNTQVPLAGARAMDS